MFEKKQPVKVIIDEAVELAKELGSDKAFGFVNAVLGKIYDNK
jgi:transcription termination factor NusB